VSPELRRRDPYNRLLARGARFRVPAETVRDITLAASGLLERRIGGPSVCPPAPAFLFQPPASYGPKRWDVAVGGDRYRRALYTFRFRSVPYPMLENFDAVPGNTSCVRRSVSNTPLQALTSLNEPMFVECSIALAARVIGEVPADAEAGVSAPDGAAVRDASDVDQRRIDRAFACCLQRRPEAQERSVLVDFLNAQRKRIAAGQLDSAEILSQRPRVDWGGTDEAELAAWTLLCRVLLNLDETITRE